MSFLILLNCIVLIVFFWGEFKTAKHR